MFESVISKLIPDKSIINHNLYHDGLFVKRDIDTIVVRFDKGDRHLSKYDYQKSWRIKNYSGYKIEGTKILGTSFEFEDQFFTGTVGAIENEIAKTKNEISDLPDQSYGSPMAAIAKSKMKLETKKKMLIQMRWNPYFARIDLVKNDDSGVGVSYYIRNVTGTKENAPIPPSQALELANVVDWYSQEAVPYYAQEMYLNEESEHRLVLLRDYQFKEDKLESFKDNLVSNKELIEQVADERLKKFIKNNRDKHINNIVQTIQANQYRIINHNQSGNILVQGCAGSGKTMILAHRLSFWLFRMQDKLDVSDALIISPTKILSREMTRLDLNINQAKFMPNFDFNKYLINHICEQLDIDGHLEGSYLSNNSLDDDIVARIYSNRFSDEMADDIELILEKEDGELVEQFTGYANRDLNRKFNEVFISRKEIDLAGQEKYAGTYQDLLGHLEKLSHLDLLEYKKDLVNITEELKEHEQLVTDLSLELKKQKRIVNDVVKGVALTHGEYVRATPKKARLLCGVWNEELVRFQGEVGEFSQLVADFNQDQATLANLKSTLYQMETNLQNANFFIRRRRERELDQAVEDFERQYALMESKYSDTGLVIEEDLSQVFAIIGEYRAYAKAEATMQATLQEALDEYGRWELMVKEAKATLARYPYDNSRIKAHQALVRTLLKNRSIITNQKRNMAEIEKTVEAMIATKIPNGLGVVNYILKYQEYLESAEYRNMKSYLEQDDGTQLLMKIVEFVIERFKQEQGIDEHHYEFEVFLKLYLLHDHKNINRISNKWVFIDEFQDYSYWEIEIYRRMFKDSSFNYFGDMRQNINAKGLSQTELELLTENKFTLFTINENYRNAREITEYVNEKFSLNMNSIGLPGSVKEGKLAQFFKAVDFSRGQTYAIVVNDENNRTLLDDYNHDDLLAFISDDDLTIAKDKVNVLTPLMVKGLEFDNVCVMTKGMKTNEKYVCCTRALQHLFIVEG